MFTKLHKIWRTTKIAILFVIYVENTQWESTMLLPEHYTVSRKDSPLMSYCKREYKNDWETVYHGLQNSSKNGLLELIINKFSILFEKNPTKVTEEASKPSSYYASFLPSGKSDQLSKKHPESDKVAA